MNTETLERIYPKKGNVEVETLRLHLQRYEFASQHLKGNRILDIACGSGYGSAFLANQHPEAYITAVDQDADAIQYAVNEYAHPRIEFIQANAMGFSMPGTFDTIISLETIEHLEHPAKFIEKMNALLTVGGRWIVSAPVTPSKDANPFHLHDFTAQSFRRLFQLQELTELDSILQVQRYHPKAVVSGSSGRKTRANLAGFYLRHPHLAIRRLLTIVKDGFVNKYLLLVFQKN